MYLFPHNPAWEIDFEDAFHSLNEAAWPKLDLIHIGSTSIKDLWSKDCIDILGVINDFDSGKKLVCPFKRLGYRYKGEHGIVGRHYFSKTAPRKIHLHLLPRGHKQIERHLHFKNVMNARPDLVIELNELKRELAGKFPKADYQLKKEPYYEKIARTRL